MDYRRIDLPAADPLLCQSECLGDAACKTFTYVKPSLHGPSAVCYLKSGAPSPTPNSCCVSGFRPEVTHAHAQSGKYQAHQQWLTVRHARSSVDGQHDTLAEYAKKCRDATGIDVPGFSCSAGTDVPGQGIVPSTVRNAIRCDQPNVLNGLCDPGSRFQVLPGGNADAVAVAHCRKVGLPIAGSLYNDIAVIQHNKQNGAICFYQALSNLPGEQIPPPSAGEGAPWQDSLAHWISPEETERIGCTGCHDNGAFIRSEYLAQLKIPPNILPNTSSGFSNLNSPVKYVGLDFATNRSWSISTSPAPNDSGTPCNTCHRLAVPNRMAFGRINGTAANFANIATAASQDSKNPYGPASPIWMRPGQVTHNASAEASATKYHDCAVGYFNSGFTSAPPGCEIRPLAELWIPSFFLLSRREECLRECKLDRDGCMVDGGGRGGPLPRECVQEFNRCRSRCPR